MRLLILAVMLLSPSAMACSPSSLTPQPSIRPSPLTADACGPAAIVYHGRVAGSFLTTIGAIRAMPLFAQGDLWPEEPAERVAVLCYVDTEGVSSPPASDSALAVAVRDMLVLVDGRPGIELVKAGPAERVPVVAP